MSDLCSVDDYAARRGVSAGAVRKAIRAGRIKAERDGRRYLIDAAAADRDWETNTDPFRGGRWSDYGPMPEPAAQPPTEPEDPVERAVREAIELLLEIEIEIEPGGRPMLATGVVLPLVALGAHAEDDPDPLRRRIRIVISETARAGIDVAAIKE